MGTKRSATASGSDIYGVQYVKRTKADPERNAETCHAESESLVGESAAYARLSSLRCLVQEAMTDPEIAVGNSEIMEALSRLNNSLQHLPGFSRPAPTVTVDASQTPNSTHPSLVSGSDSEYSGPPQILNERLSKAVFTHSACSADHDSNYDRLEILGDAYIELIATRLVWERFPGIPAGRISQIRESLVKNETLAGFSESYGFDRKALVPANYSDQPKRWIKTKADIFEAYVAAVVLSRPEGGGFQLAEQWLTILWAPKLNSLGHQKVSLRSKEALAQQIMGRNVKLEYLEERPAIQKKGTGTQKFFIGVYLTGWGWTKQHLGSGQGPSKAAAGDEAAQQALLNTDLIAEIAARKRKYYAEKTPKELNQS